MQPTLVPRDDPVIPARIAASVHAGADLRAEAAAALNWFAELGRHNHIATARVPLDELAGWRSDPVTGNLVHASGGFFSVEGLEVHQPGGAVKSWSQPIIVQRDVGILGILVKEFGGVLHCLMQAKAAPGCGLQLAPTVQATRSNYAGAQRRVPLPYLDYFRDTGDRRILADVRQSEQAARFHQKRNRNMVVETGADVELMDGFRWMSLGLVHRLLAIEDLVNMDARTVLSCLPFAGPVPAGPGTAVAGPDRFTAALLRSADPDAGCLHGMGEVLSWITERRAGAEVETALVPLTPLPSWHRDRNRIRHESGLFFDVIGVRVTAAGREAGQWSQPMVRPHGTGVVAFLVRSIGGVLHALVQARMEPGYLDVVELAPTVQCTPDNYEVLPAQARPPFLDEILRAGPERIRYATVISEEGGRFYQARSRYLIVETDLPPETVRPDYRWLTLHQLVELLRHSHYLNVQARNLVACLHSLFRSAPGVRG